MPIFVIATVVTCDEDLRTRVALTKDGEVFTLDYGLHTIDNIRKKLRDSQHDIDMHCFAIQCWISFLRFEQNWILCQVHIMYVVLKEVGMK